MSHPRRSAAFNRDGERGQILVTAVISLIAMIGGVALVLEGGNAYAHQRVAQNASDAVANAGATVIAERLAGNNRTDADVLASTTAIANSNKLTDMVAYYTDVDGHLLTPGGALAPNEAAAAQVGGGIIPVLTQGVQTRGTQTFGTTFARAIGFDQFTASADATSVTGALTGGKFLPAVFPVNIVACDGSGDLAGVGEEDWQMSEPGDPPIGQEYILPLCKTGGGSFMLLDLDGEMNNCDDEVTNPPNIQFADFPEDVASDNGNNCAKEMVDAVNELSGSPVLVPICDGDCVTTGGSHATYHIIRVASFYLDYMSDQNGGNNPACQGNGTTLIPIIGNGSSSCIAGWFVRYVTSGPVGRGPITGAGALGVQLKR